MGSLSPSIRVPTLRRAVNGGHTATSTASVSSRDSVQASFWVSWTPSRWVLCIFQLPAISGRRATTMPSLGGRDGGDAGQGLALEQLKAGPAAGGQVVDPVGQAELGQGGGRVAAAHHRVAAGGGHRLGHRLGAGGEGGQLE